MGHLRALTEVYNQNSKVVEVPKNGSRGGFLNSTDDIGLRNLEDFIAAESGLTSKKIVYRIVEKPPKLKANEKSSFVYVKFGLKTYSLTKENRRKLEGIGVECLTDGAPYEAYGVVVKNKQLLFALERMANVISITEEEPSCTK